MSSSPSLSPAAPDRQTDKHTDTLEKLSAVLLYVWPSHADLQEKKLSSETTKLSRASNEMQRSVTIKQAFFTQICLKHFFFSLNEEKAKIISEIGIVWENGV